MRLVGDRPLAAIDFILDERAVAHDPKHRDGNLPDFENPTWPPTEWGQPIDSVQLLST